MNNRPGVWLRHSQWDALLIVLALGHGLLLCTTPPMWVVAIGLWWNANTVSHNFIHLPFFRSQILNELFSAYLSVVLGFPQSLWRERHLAHHRGVEFSWRNWKPAWLLETMLLFGWWLCLMAAVPRYFSGTYLPGWILGLVLCQIQGHFEHAGGAISHYSRLYNWLFFNDGFHVEHHARPGRHWTQLPGLGPALDPAHQSRWPAVFRWLDWFGLDGLERLVIRSRILQRFVVQRHEAAFRRLQSLQPILKSVERITVVGGGLFPRSALVLQKLAPHACLKIVDARRDHLDQARRWLNERVDLVCEFYSPAHSVTQSSAAVVRDAADLVVIPLAYIGDKSKIYGSPPARHVLVHDWLWCKRGRSVIVSVLLLKRLNLVEG